jgi:hypothetical protein
MPQSISITNSLTRLIEQLMRNDGLDTLHPSDEEEKQRALLF